MWTNSSLHMPFGITTRIEETRIRYALYMCVCYLSISVTEINCYWTGTLQSLLCTYSYQHPLGLNIFLFDIHIHPLGLNIFLFYIHLHPSGLNIFPICIHPSGLFGESSCLT